MNVPAVLLPPFALNERPPGLSGVDDHLAVVVDDLVVEPGTRMQSE